MPQKLSRVELDEVSLVDAGANQLSKVVLMKRKEDTCKEDEGCDDVEKAPAGIQFVVGFKEEGGSEVQSVIFNTDTWDEEKAKGWLKAHDMESGKVDKPESGNTLRFRQKDPEGFKRFRVIKPGAQVSKALKARNSLQRVQNAVDVALREKFETKATNGLKGPMNYLWIRDFYKDAVVFDQEGQTYRCDYTVEFVDGEVQVNLNEKIPVEVVYQDVGKQLTSEPAQVPGELLVKLGRLQAHVSELHRVLKRGNPCHNKSDGKFCSTRGKGKTVSPSPKDIEFGNKVKAMIQNMDLSTMKPELIEAAINALRDQHYKT